MKTKSTRFLFFGIILGFILGVLFLVCFEEVNITNTQVDFGLRYQSFKRYFQWNNTDILWKHDTLNLEEDDEMEDEKKETEANKSITSSVYHDMHQVYRRKKDKKAKELAIKIRILCWVMTQPDNLASKAKAVKETWGKRCNVLLFMSSKNDTNFTAIGLDVSEGRENLSLKTKAAFKYVYENHYNDADWFMKVDDDTFVILENLRYFLLQYNSSDRHYFGHHFKPFGGYTSGGAGYVFSKQTLTEFYSIMDDPKKCVLKSGVEDAEIGECLGNIDIHPGDTRDKLGRKTFHPFDIQYHINPKGMGKDNWIYEYDRWEVKIGRECCSDYSITYHYINPNQMYEMEYLIYHFRAYGIK